MRFFKTDLGKGERNNAVVVVDGILHQEPVGLRLLVQDCCGKLFPENMNDCEAGAAQMRIKRSNYCGRGFRGG